MGLKLKARELPMVEFRAVLPEWLGPGEECFIEFDARAGGAINGAYVAAIEQLTLKARVMDMKAGKIEDDEAHVKADHSHRLAVAEGRFAAVYDTCVIGWRSNIMDGDAPIICDRANFIALTKERIPEIAAALQKLEKQIVAAGKIIEADDAATVKN